MSTNRHINKICVAAIVISLVLTLLFMGGASLGVVSAGSGSIMGYEERLFDTSSVHTIDIVMDDWDSFIETCENEEYSPCAVVIDGESYRNIGIRAKGNTSLSSVRSLGSRRYSFKLEFDHYENGKSYHGLDKLSLNNLIQDNTMMKDYLVYRMMGDFSVDSPLCSYVYITVNGEDWGLYLAVEGVEDGFLQRNYGSDSGELYKPDSMSFGGGRGNGREFNFDDFDFDDMDSWDMPQGGSMPEVPDDVAFPDGGFPTPPDGNIPQDGNMWQSGNITQGGGMPPDENIAQGSWDGGNGSTETDQSAGGSMTQINPDGGGSFAGADQSMGGSMPQPSENSGNGPMGAGKSMGGSMPQMPGGFGGMGSDDVKLKYIDDDPDSYSNIFNNAKTKITDTDRQRLIAALRNLSEYADLENTVDTDEVLRYFVVHNFVCNGDSYTGAMIHNYYLHEQDGQLSMIPWDYNLAFGTFEGGDAGSSVNASIDSPVSGGNVDDRPMLGWIFSDESYTERYHELFSEFTERWFSQGQLAQLIEETQTLLQPFLEKDPTKFCTVEEFDTGVQTLEKFVTLRAEAVNRQLSGDASEVDAAGLNTSDMGSMGGTMGGGFGGRNDRDFMPDKSGPDSNGESFDEDRHNSESRESSERSERSSENSRNSEISGTPSIKPGEDGRGGFQGFPDMQAGGMSPWGNISPDAAGGNGTNSALLLFGISIILLFAGLFVAIRVRH